MLAGASGAGDEPIVCGTYCCWDSLDVGGKMFEPFPFVLETHVGDDFPDWGAAPRGSLIRLDMAHAGELLEGVVGPDVETGKPRVYWVIKCELCLVIHAWPLPLPQALAHYYANQFYQAEKPDYVERYHRDAEWWKTCVHGPILAQCSVMMSHAGYEKEQVHFLDIGAGPGIALDVAKERCGWTTSGIEPNAALCEQVSRRGHLMRQGTFEETTGLYRCPIAHVLYTYEVLEHQPCPEDFLLRCYDLLEEGGLLVCTVPNDYNPLQLAAQKKLGLPSYWLAPPQHLFFWTPKTLQLCLRRAGFQILDMRGTFPMERFLLDGRCCYIGNDAVGRACHTERMAYELEAVRSGKWAQLEQGYRFNLTQRVGREIVAIARKMP